MSKSKLDWAYPPFILFKREDFIKEAEIGGAATFLEYAADADVQLFI
jgi:hypothetical protein